MERDSPGTRDSRSDLLGAFPPGIIEMGATPPPQAVLRKCELRNTAVPAPGSKKGGSLPSTSDFPVRQRGPANVAVTA